MEKHIYLPQAYSTRLHPELKRIGTPSSSLRNGTSGCSPQTNSSPITSSSTSSTRSTCIACERRCKRQSDVPSPVQCTITEENLVAWSKCHPRRCAAGMNTCNQDPAELRQLALGIDHSASARQRMSPSRTAAATGLTVWAKCAGDHSLGRQECP